MKPLTYLAVLGVTFGAACAKAPEEPQFRSYDLELVHTAPFTTYIGVAPGSQGAELPRLREMDSRAFSEYLRAEIGCVYDGSREIFPLGRKRVPAGYMVPISCLQGG